MRARRHVPSTTDATGDGLLREVAPTMAFATGVLRGRNDGSCGAGLLASFRSERRASTESFYRSIAKATPRPDDGFCDGRFTRSKRWLMWSWTTRSIRSGRSGFKGVFFSSKVRVFRVSAFANHARPPPTRPDARRGRELLLFTSDETLQALTLTELPE